MVGGVWWVVVLVVYLVVVVAGLVSSSCAVLWVVMELGLAVVMVHYYLVGGRVGSLFYYYVVQALSSVVMVVGVMSASSLCLVVGVVFKLGLFPVFVWVVSVVWGSVMGFEVVYLLFLQKVVPLVMVVRWGWVLTESGDGLLFGVVVGGLVVAGVLMSFGVSVKWLLALSSVVHTSWVVCILGGSPGSFVYYFVLYGGLLVVVVSVVGYGVEGWVGVVLVAMSTIPPLMGFLWKFYALSVVGGLMLEVLFVGVLLAVFAVYGYFSNLLKSCMVVSLVVGTAGVWGWLEVGVFVLYVLLMWLALV